MTVDAACACFPDAVPPPAVEPGLSLIPWRLSTHGGFRAAMLDRLHTLPPLARLTTRDGSDPAIALLDAWAITLDILAFYNERIGNEGFLRPATERRSVLELARLIGYTPAPGVSASTWLAVQCDTIPGSPETVALPAGTGVMSIPGPDEKPQIFETGSALVANAAWQDLRAESLSYVAPRAADTALMLAPPTQLRTGDMLLIVGSERLGDANSARFQARRVREIVDVPADAADQAPARSKVTLDVAIGPAAAVPQVSPRAFALRQRVSLFGHNAPSWDALPLAMRVGEFLPVGQAGVAHAMIIGDRPEAMASAHSSVTYTDFIDSTITGLVTVDATSRLAPGVYAGRKGSWADAPFPAGRDYVDLDQVYDRFVTGSWVVLTAGATTKVYEVTAVREVSVTDFGLSQKVTRLTLRGPSMTSFTPRSTSVFGFSEQLDWAMTPVSAPVSGREIVLNRRTTGMVAGRRVAITGTTAGTGAPFAQILTLERATDVTGGGDAAQLAPPAPSVTQLRFTTDLGVPLVARSVRINANVVDATHGETREDVIASGNAAVAFQTMPLPQRPLAFVSAASGNGRSSTLTLEVGNSRWREVAHLADASPRDRVFATRTADDGTVTVLFGDGYTGARPPSGNGNISARYRVGGGQPGMLKAGQISQPMQRPAGLAGLINPLPATGAEDPEGRDTARSNAPGTVRAMERIVSIADVADFARAFGGVSKADARLVRAGLDRAVVLTIADTRGGSPGPGDALYDNLDIAIAAARSGGDYAGQRHGLPIVIAGCRPIALVVSVALILNSDAVADATIADAREAMLAAFGFAARGFGEPASVAEAAAVLHNVSGVRAVRFARFHRGDAAIGVASVVPAQTAVRGATNWIAAELLTLDSAGLTVTEVV
jgi:predicted phage baseplate assembly protein